MVRRFLRAQSWSSASDNTLLSDETTLSRLSVDFPHFESIDEFDIAAIRSFLDAHWREVAADPARSDRDAATRPDGVPARRAPARPAPRRRHPAQDDPRPRREDLEGSDPAAGVQGSPA